MIPRCFDCGADRTTDICAACGLSGDEAELAFRRRLLTLTAVFLLGSIVFLPATQAYPPLELDGILIFIGAVFFAGVMLAVRLDRRARQHREIEALKRVFRALVPLPWLLAGLLWANGRLDASQPQAHVTTVVGKFTMPGFLRQSRITVVSWRLDRSIERVPVAREDYDRFAPGERIEVRVQEGLVGVPWVYGVYRK
jgi:hypothetical protein